MIELKRIIVFAFYLFGYALQAVGFYHTDKYNKIPVPEQYKKLYAWLDNGLLKWARESGGEMKKEYPIFETLNTIVSKMHGIEKEITSFYFTNCWHHPIDFHTALVSSFSNGLLLSNDSLANILNHMKNEGVSTYSKKGWFVFSIGLLLNLTGLCIENDMIAWQYLLVGLVYGLNIYFYTN